jgi:gluconate 5-dehydrogenase
MAVDLKGFHVVVTGGSSGFGFEMSKTLLSHGATVAIAARGGEKLTGAYNTLKAENYDVYALEMDVRSAESVELAADWVRKNWGRIDMLINNAGIGMTGVNKEAPNVIIPVFDIDLEPFMNIVETNFIGYFLVSHAFVPLMLENGGRIVNISTGIATMTAPGQLPYGPARAAAEAMSVIMSKQLKEYNITVNVLLPGGAALTGFMTKAVRERPDFDPSGLLPASIMNEPILFLASDKASGITGERIIAREFAGWLKNADLT